MYVNGDIKCSRKLETELSRTYSKQREVNNLVCDFIKGKNFKVFNTCNSNLMSIYLGFEWEFSESKPFITLKNIKGLSEDRLVTISRMGYYGQKTVDYITSDKDDFKKLEELLFPGTCSKFEFVREGEPYTLNKKFDFLESFIVYDTVKLTIVSRLLTLKENELYFEIDVGLYKRKSFSDFEKSIDLFGNAYASPYIKRTFRLKAEIKNFNDIQHRGDLTSLDLVGVSNFVNGIFESAKLGFSHRLISQVKSKEVEE